MTPQELKGQILEILNKHSAEDAERFAYERVELAKELIAEVEAIELTETITFHDSQANRNVEIPIDKVVKYVHLSESGTRFAIRGELPGGRYITRFYRKEIWESLGVPVVNGPRAKAPEKSES